MWKYEVGESVVLLDVDAIRKERRKHVLSDVGWNRDYNDMVGQVFVIQETREYEGRPIYLLYFDKHHISWWVEEEWITALPDEPEDTTELDAFFAEF